MSSERGAKLDLKIVKGKTFARTLRAGALPFIYKAITAITKAAPARVTCTGHGIPNGWPVAVVSVQGMRQIKAETDPPKADDYKQATVIDSNTIDLNAVNSSEFSAYTSGGYLQLYTPTDLAGAAVRMTIKDKVGGTALIALDSALLGCITLDNTAKTITVTVSATITAALTWLRGVYDAEIQFADGTVLPLAYGSVTVVDEVTT